MRRFIKLVEVGPRDGLQGLKTRILTPAVKATYINLLLQSGLKDVEVGSFVSDSVVQMKNTREVVPLILKTPLSNLIVLVGNKRYAEEAAVYPIDTFAVFTTVSEAFCQKNNGCDIQKNMSRIREIAHIASVAGKGLRGYVSCVFGCPYEGYPEIEYVKKTVETVRSLLDLGCYEVSIADTIGTATESTIIITAKALRQAGVDMSKIAIHLHDPQGNAGRKLIAALACDISIVDCATGNVGGCPNVPNPSANIDTSLVYSKLTNLGLSHSLTNPKNILFAALYIKDHVNE